MLTETANRLGGATPHVLGGGSASSGCRSIGGSCHHET